MTSSTWKSDADRWRAVCERDGSARAAFVYAVTSTGIYCRPGCPSRTPRQDNVRYFPDHHAAEAAGFRPCARCHPRLAEPVAADPRVQGACRRLEQAVAHEEPVPALAELARQASLSPAHFQRLFSAQVGVSPKQYAKAHRLARVSRELASGDGVTRAIHAAGYGSGSRFYEADAAKLGMAPREAVRGGLGETIHWAVADSDLGPVLVAATDKGVCAIEFLAEGEDPTAKLAARFPWAELVPGDDDFAALVGEVVALIRTPAAGKDLPLDIRGTAFQQRVWQALRRIPPGETRSYAELARELGSSGASRAVGQACAANPLAVAVPCHRVLRSDGSLGGYRWELDRKQALLDRERAAAALAEPDE